MKLLILFLALWWSQSRPTSPPIKLKGYFTCQSSLLRPQQKNALTCYARTQRNCQHGTVILAYEKCTNYPSALPLYQLADTVQVAVTPAQYLMIADCTTRQGKAAQYFVLGKQHASDGEQLRGILRVWGVNVHGQLVEVPPKTIKCLNDGFGA